MMWDNLILQYLLLEHQKSFKKHQPLFELLFPVTCSFKVSVQYYSFPFIWLTESNFHSVSSCSNPVESCVSSCTQPTTLCCMQE